MWTIKPPPIIRFLLFIQATADLTLGQHTRPPLIPFSNHGGHNFNSQEESSSSEESGGDDHYPQSYPNIGYRSKVPVGASHSTPQVSNPFTYPPQLRPNNHPHHHVVETTPATLEEIEASYENSLHHLKGQGKPLNVQGFNAPQFFDKVLDHHYFSHHQVNHESAFPGGVGGPLKAPFRPSAPFTPNFESTSGFKPSFGPPVKGPLGHPTYPLGTSGLRPAGHAVHGLIPSVYGPLGSTYIPSSRPNLFKDLDLTFPPPTVVYGIGDSTLPLGASHQYPDESKKSSHSVSIQPSHVPPSNIPTVPVPVKEEYKVIFVKGPTTTPHSPYRAASPIVLKRSKGPLLASNPTEQTKGYHPTQAVSSSQVSSSGSSLKPEEQALLYHLFSKTEGPTTVPTPTTTVSSSTPTSTTTKFYLAEEPQSGSALADYSFGDILKISSGLVKPKKKKKSKDKSTAYSISHPYIIPLRSPKFGLGDYGEISSKSETGNKKKSSRLIPVNEDRGFMLTYAPTYSSPVASASSTIPTFVDYTQHGNEVEALLKAYGVQPGLLPKGKEGGGGGPTSIEDPPTFYTSTTSTTTSGTTSTTTPSPYKRIRVKPPTTEPVTESTTTTEPPTTFRTRGTTTEKTDSDSGRSKEVTKAPSRKEGRNKGKKSEEEQEEISEEYEDESQPAPTESEVSVPELPESEDDYDDEGEESESSEEEEEPIESKTKKNSRKEILEERPKTLDERKRKNVVEGDKEDSSEEERNVKSSKSARISRVPSTLSMLYEPKKTTSKRSKGKSGKTKESEEPEGELKEARKQGRVHKKDRTLAAPEGTEATRTIKTSVSPKNKKWKSRDSLEEGEVEEVETRVTTKQPRMGKKNPTVELILESIRNSQESVQEENTGSSKEERKTSKRQRIKPSVAKRLQKSGGKLRKVRRKNKRKKSRAS